MQGFLLDLYVFVICLTSNYFFKIKLALFYKLCEVQVVGCVCQSQTNFMTVFAVPLLVQLKQFLMGVIFCDKVTSHHKYVTMYDHKDS